MKTSKKNQPLKGQTHSPSASQTGSSGRSKKTYFIQGLILFLFAIALYLNTLGHDYAVDDAIVIVNNFLTKQGFAGIPKIMTTDAFYGFFGENYKFVAGGRYRPLSIVSFAVEYQLLGQNPFVSHLINVILYGLTAIVVFITLSQMLRASGFEKHYFSIPFIATLIYIAHPLHTEAVANIKGRDEIMGMIGSLLTLYFSLKYIRLKEFKYLAGVFLCFLPALLSKENSVTFLAIIPLAFHFFSEAKVKEYIPVMAMLIIMTVVFIILRQQFTAISFTEKSNEILNNAFLYATPAEKFATISSIMGKYILLLFFPITLTHDYYYNQIPMVSWSNPAAIISLLTHIGLMVYAVMNFKKKDAFAFCILFYFCSLSIVTNIVVNVGTTMSERFLYMPSLGFALAVAIGIKKLSEWKASSYPSQSSISIPLKPVSIALVLLFALPFSAKTIHRNMAWKDDFTLFKTDVYTSTGSAKLANAFGGAMIAESEKEKDETKRKQMVNEAIRSLKRAVEIYPTYHNAWLLLGNGYFNIDEKDKAEQCYQKTLTFNPDYFEGNFNLGLLLNNTNRPAEAIPFFETAIRTKSTNYEAVYNLGESYYMLNQPDKAIESFQKVLKMNPKLHTAMYKIGVAYGRQKNDLDSSILYISKAIELNPREKSYYEDLGVAYGLKGELQEAVDAFETVLKLDPSSSQIYFNLGITYKQMGNKAKADEYLAKAGRQ